MNKITLSDFINDWLLKYDKKPKILNYLAKEKNTIEISNKVGDDKSNINWFINNFNKIKIRSYQPPNIVDYLDFHFVLKNLNLNDFIESDLTQNLIVIALDLSDKNGKSIFIKQKHPCSDNELYYKKLRTENYNNYEKSNLDNFNFTTISALNMDKKPFQNYIRIFSLCLCNQLFRRKLTNELFFIDNIRSLASILNLPNDFVSNFKLSNSNLINVIAKKFKNQLFKPIMGKIIIETYIDSVISRKRENIEFLNQILMNQNFLIHFGIVELISIGIEKIDVNIDDILMILTDKFTIKEIERWLPVYRIIEKYLRIDKLISLDFNELSYIFSGMISDSFHSQLDLELYPITIVFFSGLLDIEIDWNRIIVDQIEDNYFDKEFLNFYIKLGKRFKNSIKLFNQIKSEI